MQKRHIPDRTVSEWVDYIQTLHHSEIELGIERVAKVYRRLYPDGMPCKVISVAGTNGKGSTAEIIASIYHQAGYKVGKFSSPHLIDFGERYLINGANASDQALLDAFVKIEQARADIPITYFEFGALLAVELFCEAKVDVAVMEVGLGGRLDAINMLDADVALITSISIDHTAWLGNTIEKIAYEKAGIAREASPCVVGIREPAQSIIDYCDEIKSDLQVLGQSFDYQFDKCSNQWSWQSNQSTSSQIDRHLTQLPLPFSQAGVQLSNAAIAIQAVNLLNDGLLVSDQSIVDGIAKASIQGRCQIFSQKPLTILDVAHNESSVQRLREFVDGQRINKNIQQARVYALCGMLKDKEVAQSLACMTGLVEHWHLATIYNERGADAHYLQEQLNSVDTKSNKTISLHDSVNIAYNDVLKIVKPDDILIVFGSFFVVGDILKATNKH